MDTMRKYCKEELPKGCLECDKEDMFGDVCHAYQAYKDGDQNGYERGYKQGWDKGYSNGEFLGKNKAFDKVIEYLNDWKDKQGVFISVNSLIKKCEEFRET